MRILLVLTLFAATLTAQTTPIATILSDTATYKNGVWVTLHGVPVTSDGTLFLKDSTGAITLDQYKSNGDTTPIMVFGRLDPAKIEGKKAVEFEAFTAYRDSIPFWTADPEEVPFDACVNMERRYLQQEIKSRTALSRILLGGGIAVAGIGLIGLTSAEGMFSEYAAGQSLVLLAGSGTLIGLSRYHVRLSNLARRSLEERTPTAKSVGLSIEGSF